METLLIIYSFVGIILILCVGIVATSEIKNKDK